MTAAGGGRGQAAEGGRGAREAASSGLVFWANLAADDSDEEIDEFEGFVAEASPELATPTSGAQPWPRPLSADSTVASASDLLERPGGPKEVLALPAVLLPELPELPGYEGHKALAHTEAACPPHGRSGDDFGADEEFVAELQGMRWKEEVARGPGPGRSYAFWSAPGCPWGPARARARSAPCERPPGFRLALSPQPAELPRPPEASRADATVLARPLEASWAVATDEEELEADAAAGHRGAEGACTLPRFMPFKHQEECRKFMHAVGWPAIRILAPPLNISLKGRRRMIQRQVVRALLMLPEGGLAETLIDRVRQHPRGGQSCDPRASGDEEASESRGAQCNGGVSGALGR